MTLQGWCPDYQVWGRKCAEGADGTFCEQPQVIAIAMGRYGSVLRHGMWETYTQLIGIS